MNELPPDLASLLHRSTEEAYVEVFRALSEPLRVRILSMIASAGDDEYPCTALEEKLPISKSTISYHIKILSKAGLISVRKEGRNFRYRLKRPVVDYFVPQFLDRIAEEPVGGSEPQGTSPERSRASSR